MSTNRYIKLISLHLFLGLIIYAVPFLSKIYLVGILVFFTRVILSSKGSQKTVNVLIACSYIVGAEVFLRMTGGNLLYEASKYSVIAFLFLGMLIGDSSGKNSYPYIIYLLLLLPGILVAYFNLNYNTNFRKAVAFNLSGPICLGIAALYCYKRPIKLKSLQTVLLFGLLPIISTTVYLFLYTPSIKDVVYGTGSNFAASGGFGPNQVSTVLGLGVFLLTGRLFLQSKSLFLKIINISILILITYRAIVTFSRGGVLVAFIIVVAFVFSYYFRASFRSKSKILWSVVVLIIGMMLTWYISSETTLGLIDKRYSNQDAIGREKSDITTGRSKIFTAELNEFLENPFLGVGVGKLKEIRYEKEGVLAASHNEMSRIVGEHGLFGFSALLTLLFVPLFLRLKNRRNIYFFSFYLFWLLTINHSSMRIAAPAFIYGMCLLNVTYDKSTLHRKQTLKKRKNTNVY